MPTARQKRRPPAPRTVLQRYTVRLDRREATLSLLVHSSPEGSDIYEIARRKATAQAETEEAAAAAVQAAVEAAVAATKQQHREEEDAPSVGTNEGGNQGRLVDDGIRQARYYGQPAQQQQLLAPSRQAAALQAIRTSSSEPKSVPPAGAPSGQDGSAADRSGAVARSTDEIRIADRAEAITEAAVLDAIRLAKAARVEGEEAVGPAVSGGSTSRTSTRSSMPPPEAATRLFGDVRAGLEKSSTGELCIDCV